MTSTEKDTDGNNKDQQQQAEGPSASKKAKTWHKHTFCDLWLKVPEFTGWLAKATILTQTTWRPGVR